jgi:type II secretion system protein E
MKYPFGKLLVDKKIITQEKLDIALQKQQETGERLGAVLCRLGYIDDEALLLPLLAEQLQVEFVNLRSLSIDEQVIPLIPARFASYYKIMPLNLRDHFLTIAAVHPMDTQMMDGIHMVVPYKIKTVLASEKDIMEAIRQYYGVGAETIDQMMGTVDLEDKVDRPIDNLEQIDSEASIGKFLNQILFEAYKDRATDIHIEPFEKELKIRYRVDGVLYDTQIPANIWHFKDSINSRIKIMSNLNIAEKRLPQDGKFKVKVGDVDLDLRVSFLPTPFGESVVIRILSSTKLLSLAQLGLSPSYERLLEEVIKKPHGLIFVTGPTGSGKTTTLYACLSQVKGAEKKIITIEDPIEYQLQGITQIQIQPHIGLTFAAGLRSMLRHDPDIMMVGEVRDLETAEIAVQIALTGHLVFSTLHTNDAASGVTRLIDMGVEPYLITSSVEVFIAQRLIRMICPKCKEPRKVTPELLKDFGLDPEREVGMTIFEGMGCGICNHTGYHGREGIYEFLVMNDSIRELILARASATQIKNQAVAMGMRPLMEHGWEKVKQGRTTASEIVRVSKEDSA